MMYNDNISSNQEALNARRNLKKERSKPKTDTNFTKRDATYPENLTSGQQPGAAQLIRKLQNRMRRKQAQKRRLKIVTPAVTKSSISSTLPYSQIPATMGIKEEVPEEQQGSIQNQLEQIRKKARTEKAVVNKSRAVKKLKSVGSKLSKNIWKHRAKLPMLFGVLAVALLKDFLDAMGEILTVGIWSWFDWMIDLSLGIAAFLLGIEKDPKARMIGWGFMGLEAIPYVGLLPSWTLRVLLAMFKSLKEIRKSKKSLNKVQKKIKSLSP